MVEGRAELCPVLLRCWSVGCEKILIVMMMMTFIMIMIIRIRIIVCGRA